ncbi:hypothetical protein NQ315_005786 [Exocentrus adspersus]|uniref:Uncharacterized protein n=1 Tax=Exocentrus adspersus TaxID=1586481 RepID=A0AAV8VSU8_9CUCU|nr:hypothetical protein NQ315_005786 [Exocentrus adspersus]
MIMIKKMVEGQVLVGSNDIRVESKFNAKMKLLKCCIFSLVLTVAIGAELKEEFTWTRISYDWPKSNRVAARSYIKNSAVKPNRSSAASETIVFEGQTNSEDQDGDSQEKGDVDGSASFDYQYENNIPMGANVWQDKLFITVPRRRLGVPSSLNYVSLKKSKNPNRHNVPLIPYPSWEKNTYPDTSGRGDNFVSVYRVAVDTCDRLWFVDTGTVETLGNVTHAKPTTLIIMDLQTDQIIRQYPIPEDQLRPTTGLASITLDVEKPDCEDSFAYLPDLGGYGLIVYSYRENRSWRVSHNYFFLEPLAGEFFIAGHHFQWNDGIFSAELTALKPDGFRDMYFHSMAGTHVYRVSTRVLRNETLATRSYHGNDFENIGDKGALYQTSSADIDKSSGIMFMGLVNQNAVGCWNTMRPLNSISIVHKDPKRMIYPSDVKIYNEKVYVLSNTMPGFLYGRLNYDETNFRVWSNSITDATEGTNC